MIEATEFSMRIARNEPLRIPLVFTEDGVPKDISGWTIKMAIAISQGVTPALVVNDVATANGSVVTLTDAATGNAEILITKLDLVALPEDAPTLSKQFSYDILCGPSSGDINRFYYGALTVDQGVNP